MIEWWNSLSVMMKILWGITLSASLIFIVQSVMTFLGADSGNGDFDMDTDVSGDVPDGSDAPDAAAHGTGQGLLTFRNFVNFFLGFGWCAILLRNSVSSTPLLLVISVLVGVGLVVLVLLLFLSYPNMYKMKNDLGLTDDEMTSLFGSNYVRDPQADNTDLLPRDNNSTDQ